ncbi:hypothetical protein D3C80_1961310 [compost metagenome]
MNGALPWLSQVSSSKGIGGNRLAHTTKANISRTFERLMMTLPTLQLKALTSNTL